MATTTILAPVRHGILLNPSPSTYHATLPIPSSSSSDYSSGGSWGRQRSPRYNTSPLPSTTTMSYPASSSSSTQSSPRSGPRKIRFAPLPDPRRSVLVTDDGEELPLPSQEDDDDDEEDLLTPPDETPGEWASIASVVSDSPIQSTTPLASSFKSTSSPYPTTCALPDISCPSTPQQSQSSSVLGKARRALMKPLLTSSASNKEPASAPASAALDARFGSLDDLRTFGTGLLRVSSRDSTSTAGGRGSRASSRERPITMADDFGSPLVRTQSSQSAKRPAKRPPSRSSLLSRLGRSSERSKTAPVSPSTPNTAAPRTIRMLNGHVYGQKKKHAVEQKNLFDSARSDDEFVEWGYGGAGSVKTAKELGVSSHSALQGKSSVTAGHADEDEDDGSGMAWIKKRKMEREREAAMKAAAAAAAVPPPAIDESDEPASEQPETSTPVVAPVPVEESKPVEEPKAEAAEAIRPTYSAESTSYTHTTLCVPAPHWNDAENGFKGDHSEGVRTPSSTTSSESPSRDETEESSPDSTSLENDNGDEEERMKEVRKTSLGASVEIISRHKEKQDK